VSAETVLIVDQPREAEAAKLALASCSYHVMTAGGAERALEILKSEQQVGMVLSEAMLPGGISGLMLLAKIRVCYPATAVMLMTSLRNRPSDVALPVLIKPFTAASLVDRVDRLLADHRRIAASLTTAFEWNRTAREELDIARRALKESVRQSRIRRSEEFCSRLSMPGVLAPTILVTEESAGLRYAICRFLGRGGFKVLEAADGAAALKLSREYSGTIELFLTGDGMPGLEGTELVNIIARERPLTNIIVMTSDDLRLPQQTIRKPFELDDLLAEIIGVLIRT
jgi:DNA-binding response OmpR family regulator